VPAPRVARYPPGPPKPSRGRGDGGTGFPHPPAHGLRPHLSGGGGGEPGSFIPLRTGCALTFPGAEAGNRVPPSPCARAAPSPFRGRRRGETRFPHAPPREPVFTLAVHAAAPHNTAMNIRLFLGGLRPPRPSQGPGPECAGLRPASAEGWGNPVSPPPSPRAYVHVRPHARGAHRPMKRARERGRDARATGLCSR